MTQPRVVLTGTYTDGDGSPLTGSLQFAPSTPLTDSTDELSIRQEPVTVYLNAEGQFSEALYPTDAANLTPSGWQWDLREAIEGLPAASYTFSLPGNVHSFTATSATPCVFTAAGSAYTAGQAVTLWGSSLPAGFTAGVVCYVVSPSGTTFSLAATSGGSAIASTSTGSGSVNITQDISALI
jgi:hypothetical protein